MKVVRVLTYEGTEEGLDDQLSMSLPDGKRDGCKGVTIHVRTVVDERPIILLEEVKAAVAEERAR